MGIIKIESRIEFRSREGKISAAKLGAALLFNVNGSPVIVPEPGQVALMLLGGISFFVRSRYARIAGAH